MVDGGHSDVSACTSQLTNHFTAGVCLARAGPSLDGQQTVVQNCCQENRGGCVVFWYGKCLYPQPGKLLCQQIVPG